MTSKGKAPPATPSKQQPTRQPLEKKHDSGHRTGTPNKPWSVTDTVPPPPPRKK